MSSKFKPVEEKKIVKTTPSSHETILYSGEKISKSDKTLVAMGTIEELIAYIGVIKAEHYNSDSKIDTLSSAKLFLFARMTKIQEALLDINKSIGTTKKTPGRYDLTRFVADDFINEFDKHITEMGIDLSIYKTKDKPLIIFPGTTILESNLLFARALCRRAERQLVSAKNVQLGVVVDPDCFRYLNKLGDYLLALAIQEPTKRKK